MFDANRHFCKRKRLVSRFNQEYIRKNIFSSKQVEK